MAYSLQDLMQLVVVERGEAVHLDDGEAPVLEIRGQLHRIEGPRLESGDAQTLFRSIAPKDEFQAASRSGLAAFEVRHGETAFFRVMAFRAGDRIRVELRRVL
jgi:Tfp pilus assembly pilus retraction ATPase PilT